MTPLSHTLASSFVIAVSATLRYGYYGDSRILLGPASSRLVKASSVFVKQVEVSNKHDNQVILHAFNEKPELSSQINWTASNFFLVGAYQRKGISLWLNKGSTIRLRWEAHSREKKIDQLQPKQTRFPSAIAVRKTLNSGEAEYIVEEDDRYHIGVLNMNARNIIMTMKINVSAKVYDTTKANKKCSIANGSCRLSFIFPNTHYVILTTTNNGDGEPYVEFTLVARVLTYVLLLGFIMIVVYLILKFLGISDGDDQIQNTNVRVDTYRSSNVIATQTETEPLMQVESNSLSYGTIKEDDDGESEAYSSSSEELYDEKLCVICYDEQRNSFFVPCGHCATCYDCAQRISEGESKVCPICRRLVHKVRRLFHS
ncbi:Zinc finger, RING-type [Sesbania bispinosa]|nr:Zinc finger, RING-type [Sesbania bispinosa]